MAVIRYFCDDHYQNTLISDSVKTVVNAIGKVLAGDDYIGVYPDAMYENWGIPTGLLFVTAPESAILFPTLLRDPGCGFLVFKVEISPKAAADWHVMAGDLLDGWVRRPSCNLNEKATIEDIVNRGLGSIEADSLLHDYGYFQDAGFDVFDHDAFTDDEIRGLRGSLCTVANTIELRTIAEVLDRAVFSEWQVNDNDVIGLIHTGCGQFENILERRFAYRVAEQSIEEGIFALDEIEKGIFGIRLQSKMGSDLFQWIKMAMNYAIVNRYSVYLAVKHLLETRFPCRASPIRDAIHCGIYQQEATGASVYKIFRGVQSAYGCGANPTMRRYRKSYTPTLLAGHKETIAALVCGEADAAKAFGMVAHGTGWAISPEIKYGEQFTRIEQARFNEFAERAYYNTHPDPNRILPYTYNLISSLAYFSDIKLVRPVAYLAPLVNIQGAKRLPKSRPKGRTEHAVR